MTKAKQLPNRKHKEDLLSSHSKSTKESNQDYRKKNRYHIKEKGSSYYTYSDKSVEELRRLKPGCEIIQVPNIYLQPEALFDEVDIDPYS